MHFFVLLLQAFQATSDGRMMKKIFLFYCRMMKKIFLFYCTVENKISTMIREKYLLRTEIHLSKLTIYVTVVYVGREVRIWMGE
jgi:hypothetical protein